MGEHDHVRKLRLAELLHRHGGARHLHERENAFLHARAAGSGKQDERALALHGRAHTGDHRFACGGAERAAEEIEILHCSHDFLALELPCADEHGISKTSLAAGVLDPVGVAPLVTELERIDGHLGELDGLVLAPVKQTLQPGWSRDAHVIVRARHHELVGFEILVIDHLPRLRAFHPEIVRHLLLAKDAPDFGPHNIVDPVHGSTKGQEATIT
jgi:hypothetical protein